MRRVGAKGGMKEKAPSKPPKSMKSPSSGKHDAPGGAAPTVGKGKAGAKRKGYR